MKRATQQGFTLIELIMVIVILGVLAATALPKFLNMGGSARYASLQGLQGSLNSAAAIAYAQSLVNNTAATAATNITTSDGTVVATVYGYPAGTAAGIGTMVTSSGYTVAYASGVATYTIPGATTCSVTYTAATSASVPASVAILPTTASASTC